MAATCTPKAFEQGSVRRQGAGYGKQVFDLTAAGGTTTLTVPMNFYDIESIDFMPQTPAGAVGSWVPNAADPSKVDLTFTANFVGQIAVTGRGM